MSRVSLGAERRRSACSEWRLGARYVNGGQSLDLVSPPAGEPLHFAQRHATACVEEETQEL